MNYFKQHWYVILLAIFTGGLAVVVFLTSQKLKQEEPVAPTVPQVAPEAAQPGTCGSFTEKSSCDSAGCTGGFTCKWNNQQGACKKTETRCSPPPQEGAPDPGTKDYCSGITCDVEGVAGCYINHYGSDNRNDQTITDRLLAGPVQKSSLGLRNCGAEQIDVSCNNESIARRYTQDCVENTPTPKTQIIVSNTPTPTKTVTPTQIQTPTPTPGSTATPTPTLPPGTTPTPTTPSTPTPTTPLAFAPSPTPTIPATPNVPVSGTGPSLLGGSIIAGGLLLLLLGLVF